MHGLLLLFNRQMFVCRLEQSPVIMCIAEHACKPIKAETKSESFFSYSKLGARGNEEKTSDGVKNVCIYTSIVLKDSHQECLQCEKNKQMSAEASNKIGKFVDCRQHFTYMYKKHINEVDRMCMRVCVCVCAQGFLFYTRHFNAFDASHVS